MLRSQLLALAALTFGNIVPSTCPAQTVGQAASAKTSLRAFLERFDADLKGRFIDAFVDLNGDGGPEAVVYLTGNEWCGSGGCTTLILVRDGDSWRLMTKVTVTRPPIRVLATKSNGWQHRRPGARWRLSTRLRGGTPIRREDISRKSIDASSEALSGQARWRNADRAGTGPIAFGGG
jgi:hypothetical protein